jgi:peptide deformylase
MSTPVDSPEIGRLELVEYPHPALLRRTRPLVRIDDAIHDAVEQMFDIMYTAGGIGLAANQVGLPYRLFIVNLEARPDAGEELVFINPSLSRPRGNAVQEEGCLSLPDIRGDVLRPPTVTIRALGLDGREFTQTGTGLLARCWQHEYDHLEGVLIIDKMTQMSRIRNKTAIRDLERG